MQSLRHNNASELSLAEACILFIMRLRTMLRISINLLSFDSSAVVATIFPSIQLLADPRELPQGVCKMFAYRPFAQLSRYAHLSHRWLPLPQLETISADPRTLVTRRLGHDHTFNKLDRIVARRQYSEGIDHRGKFKFRNLGEGLCSI
jgi:hypothetical protein